MTSKNVGDVTQALLDILRTDSETYSNALTFAAIQYVQEVGEFEGEPVDQAFQAGASVGLIMARFGVDFDTDVDEETSKAMREFAASFGA